MLEKLGRVIKIRAARRDRRQRRRLHVVATGYAVNHQFPVDAVCDCESERRLCGVTRQKVMGETDDRPQVRHTLRGPTGPAVCDDGTSADTAA